jgi:hypothetical protein
MNESFESKVQCRRDAIRELDNSGARPGRYVV